MSHNPEDSVIDAIDELVNEQLAIGPVDDYNADRYVKCPACQCDWHGIRCEHCGCTNCDGEVSMTERLHRTTNPAFRRTRRELDLNLDAALSCAGIETRWREIETRWREDEAVEGFIEIGTLGEDDLDPVFRHTLPSAPWVIHSEQTARRGYTLADIEAMRGQWGSWWSALWSDLPSSRRPRVIRFWSYDPETNRLHMIEGTAEVMQIDRNRDSTTARMRMDPYREVVGDVESFESLDLRPVGDITTFVVVAIEAATPDGFELIGYLAPENFEIEHNCEIIHAWGRSEVAYALQETHEVRIRVPNGETFRQLNELR